MKDEAPAARQRYRGFWPSRPSGVRMVDEVYRRLTCAGCAVPFKAIRKTGRLPAKGPCCSVPRAAVMDKTPRQCGACGTQFVPVKRVQGACSKKCARQMRQPLKPLLRLACLRCGTEFQQSQPSARVCSRSCKTALWRTNNPARAAEHDRSSRTRAAERRPAFSTYIAKRCVRCGRAWAARREWTECGACKAADRKEAARIASRALAIAKHKAAGKVVACDECGGKFCPLYGSKIGATPLCMVCSETRKRRARAETSGTNAHRAKLKGAPRRYFNEVKQVLERDRWRCQICGQATPKRLRGTTEPNAPEVDHIVPLAEPGTPGHVPENCQCSCRACNLAKGAKPLGQMNLALA